jgi:glutamyl-tRNA reductase
VSNRNYERAVELAQEMSGTALTFEQWESELSEVDILISSTSAPHFVVTVPVVERAMQRRRGRPLFMIDIAVPRDIEPGVNDLEDVFLYDIDQLQSIADERRREREMERVKCEEIIDAELKKFGI